MLKPWQRFCSRFTVGAAGLIALVATTWILSVLPFRSRDARLDEGASSSPASSAASDVAPRLRPWPIESLDELSFDETLTLLSSEIESFEGRPESLRLEGRGRVERVAARLAALHDGNLARIAEAGRWYESHSPAAAARFAAFRGEYQARWDSLQEVLTVLDSDPAGAAARLSRLLRDAGALKSPPAVPPAGELPHRRLRPLEREPRSTSEEWAAGNKVGCAPGPEGGGLRSSETGWLDALLGPGVAHAQGGAPGDLDTTPEVELSPAIVARAEELGRSPARIVSWVSENIEFVPIWGALQTSTTCLATRRGTAMDIASLTIALLRASGVESRYQAGTVRIPMALAMSWLGNFESATAASSLLASGGIPAVVQVDAKGQPVALRFEHVWVRAHVDYVPHQGACHVAGDTWLDIDATIRARVYPTRPDLTAFVPWRTDAGALSPEDAAREFLESLVEEAETSGGECGAFSGASGGRLDAAFGPLPDAVAESVLASLDLSLSMRQILGAGAVRKDTSGVLGASPPFEVLARGSERSALEEADRFGVTIRLEQAGRPVLELSSLASAIGLSRFTVLFRPATAVDAAIVRGQLTIPEDTETEPMFDAIYVAGVNVVPELWRDGRRVDLAQAAAAVPMGAPLELVVDYVEPVLSTPAIRASLLAGEPTAIGLDLVAVPTPLMAQLRTDFDALHSKLVAVDPSFEPLSILDCVLSGAVHAWFREVDRINGVSSLAMGCVTHRYPSAGVCAAKWEVDSTFGLPLGIRHRGLTMDIPGDVVILLPRDATPAKMLYCSLFQGFSGSALESQIPASFFHNELEPSYWLGTSDMLAMAGRLGDSLVLLSSDNADCILGTKLHLSPAAAAEIRAAVDRGLVVFTHTSELAALSSTQSGYAILDPATGSGIFRVEGGFNGANRARCVLDANPVLPPAADRLVRLWGGSFDKDGTANTLGEIALHIMDFAEAADVEPGQPITLAAGALRLFSTIQNTMARYAKDADLYEKAAGVLGEGAKPLAGLVVLFTGLELINQIVNNLAPPPLGSIVGVAGGKLLEGVANAAWTGVRNIIRHQVQLEAATEGIVIPSDCLELLFAAEAK